MLDIESIHAAELRTAVTAAREAGEAVRDLYDRAAAETYIKGDGSPVTDADLLADKLIRARLGAAFPDDALLTEEGVDDEARLGNPRVWIVDPIDGTAQFVARSGEFDVLIALAVEGRLAVGVLLHPPTGRWLAAADGAGAWVGEGERIERFSLRAVSAGRQPRIATSVWLGAPGSLPALGRVSGRLGAAPPIVSDLGVYLRHLAPPDNAIDALVGLPPADKPTMAWEWDFAAADIVAHEAGGRFTDVRGDRFVYNKRLPRNEGGLLMSVDPTTHGRILEALRPELPKESAIP